MTDSPKIDLVLSDLEREIAKPEPFTVVLSKNKRITFKDPFGFKISERAEIVELYEASKRGDSDDIEFLKKIMSPADHEKYVAEDLPIRTHEALIERVMAHFQGALGDSGNGTASAS